MVLGFVHEQTRPDRDRFIDLNEDNIKPGYEKDFEKREHGDDVIFSEGSVNAMNTPYDMGSLMHYGPKQAAKSDEPVFSFRHPENEEDYDLWPGSSPDEPLSLIDQVDIVKNLPFFFPLHTKHLNSGQFLSAPDL